MTSTKPAADLAIGDRVDLSDIDPYTDPIRTVTAVRPGDPGFVKVAWAELPYVNSIPSGRPMRLVRRRGPHIDGEGD